MEVYAIILAFADLMAIAAEKMHDKKIMRNCQPNPPSKAAGEIASKKGAVKNADNPVTPYLTLPIK